MPKVQMPDGKTVFFPDDMPKDQMKAAAQKYVANIQPQEIEQDPDYWRGAAEMAGGALGALATTPLTPVGQVAGGALGAAMGGQAYDLVSDLVSGREDRTLAEQSMRAAEDVGFNLAVPAVATPVLQAAGRGAKHVLSPITERVAEPVGRALTAAGEAVRNPIRSHLKRSVGPVGARTAQEIAEMEAAGFRPEIGMIDTPEAQNLSQSLRNMPASSGVMAEVDRQNLQTGAKKALEIAERLGDPVGAELAGEAIKRDAAAAQGRFFEVADSLYDKAAAFTPEMVPAKNVRAMAGDIVAKSKSSGIAQEYLAEPARLASVVLSDIAEDGTIGRETLRSIKKMAKPSYRKSDALLTDSDRFIRQLERAADSDLYESAIATGGKEAQRAVDTAKNWWKAGVGNAKVGEAGHLDDIANIMKQTEAGKVTQWLRREDKYGAERLGRVLNFVSPDTAGKIRATAFMELGTPPAGQLDAAGEGFSFASFLTNANKLSDSAKTVLFGKAKKDFTQLAKISEYMKALQKQANMSGTARQTAFNTMFKPISDGMVQGAATGGLPGAVRGAFMGTGAAVGKLAINNKAAKLISDPEFVKWLASTSNKVMVKPTNIGPQLIRLGAIAANARPERAELYKDYLHSLGMETTTTSDKSGKIKSIEVK